MPRTLKTILTACIASAVFAAVPAQAENDTGPETVMATVNGTEITLGHVIAMRAALPPQYDQFPAELLYRGIMDQLIQQTLLSQSREGELSLQNRMAIENERRAIIAADVMNEVTSAASDEAMLRDLYDERFTTAPRETEYRASHILVATEEEAKSLIGEIQSGADFSKLATTHSTGPSGASGGDLGWFGKGDMVAEFFDTVAALEPGQVSEPVKTEFGWHVIKLVETRLKEHPKFEAVRNELEEQVRQERLEAFVAGLEADADIERAELPDFNPEKINEIELLEN